MKAVKGFNPDDTCHNFKFKEGETYHEDGAKLCKYGFHACEDPIDCFKYYAPANSVYREVELHEVSPEREGDSKLCAKTIKIGHELGAKELHEFHKIFVHQWEDFEQNIFGDYDEALALKDGRVFQNGDVYALAARDGNALEIKGESSCACCNSNSVNSEDGTSVSVGSYCVVNGGHGSSISGMNTSFLSGGSYCSISCLDSSFAKAKVHSSLTGGYGSSLTAGCNSALASMGDGRLSGGANSALSCTSLGRFFADERCCIAGQKTASVSAGNYACIAVIGGFPEFDVGNESIIVFRGVGCKFKAGIGSIITIAAIGKDDPIVHRFQTIIVDGKTVKSDVWYRFDANGLAVMDEK